MRFLALAVLTFATEAFAIIGRPATPLSVAGVARRTTYRAVTASRYAYGTAAVATTAAITVLPAGCGSVLVQGGTYYNCAGTYYRPVYNGPNVSYVVTPAP